jgi:hypothetical protein
VGEVAFLMHHLPKVHRFFTVFNQGDGKMASAVPGRQENPCGRS